MNTLDKQKYLFANFFLIANKLQVKGDSYLRDITTKQWFLLMIISQFKEQAPMLTEVANLMGSSRQNVKQLALKLQEKGFLTLEKDEADGRTLRLKLTEKNQDFWEERQDRDAEFIAQLFKNLTVEEMDHMVCGFKKIIQAMNE